MNSQTKYKDKIIKELQDMPDEDMLKLLEIIHCLKTGMKESRKKVRGYVFEIGKIAFEDKAKNLLENDEVRKSFLGG